MKKETFKAVIVDDELHCRASLAKLLEWSAPQVKVIKTFEKPIEAQQFLNTHDVDILFLDIDMPAMNGFELLQGIDTIRFDVIFTTAYDEFALQAFKVHATSYLLKPIDEEELLSALDIVASKQQIPLNQDIILQLFESMKKGGQTNKVAIPTMEGLEFIDKDKIIRCSSEGNYTRIFINGRQPLLISKTLKVVAELISAPHQFVRPHASHLVNINYVAKYIKGTGGQLILDDGFVIPVSKHKKSGFLDSL